MRVVSCSSISMISVGQVLPISMPWWAVRGLRADHGTCYTLQESKRVISRISDPLLVPVGFRGRGVVWVGDQVPYGADGDDHAPVILVGRVLINPGGHLVNY